MSFWKELAQKLDEEIELEKEIIEELRAIRNTMKEMKMEGFEKYYDES